VVPSQVVFSVFAFSQTNGPWRNRIIQNKNLVAHGSTLPTSIFAGLACNRCARASKRLSGTARHRAFFLILFSDEFAQYLLHDRQRKLFAASQPHMPESFVS
jgi:hypothetical protein